MSSDSAARVPRPVMLVVMDGWGLRDETAHNAIRFARTPNVTSLGRTWPYTTLKTSGRDVGLPDGQMGNSEVGHLNLGAGRIVWQEISRIDEAIADGTFFRSPALVGAIDHARAEGTRLHLLGLVSDGGVHSSDRHLEALLEVARRGGLTGDRVVVHAFLDGRDTPPDSAAKYVDHAEAGMASRAVGRITTVIGRYYAMDRDERWERVQRAYDALTRGIGETADSALGAPSDQGGLHQPR